MKAPALDRPLIPVCGAHQLQAMLDRCSKTVGWGARDRAIILTLLHTGVRLGEVYALDPRDLDLTEGVAQVRRGKGSKGRLLHLPPEAGRAIVAWLPHRRARGPSDDTVLWQEHRRSSSYS